MGSAVHSASVEVIGVLSRPFLKPTPREGRPLKHTSHESRVTAFPIPGSRVTAFPIPDSRFPIPEITGHRLSGITLPVTPIGSRRARRWLAVCLTIIAACGGDGTSPPLPVASVQVTPASSTLSPGQTAQLTATPLDAQQRTLTNRTITWSSTNLAVATVSTTGLVTAVAVGGPVTIVATSEGQDGSATVTVVPPPVATVSVTPATPTLTPGAVVQLTATLRDASGATLTNRVVNWTSSNTALATVSGAGLVTAVAVGGPVTITATSEGQSGTAALSVIAPIVTTVQVSPSATTVSIGGTTPLTAIVRDQNNIILTGRVVTWTTSNAAIATVSQQGSVTGVVAGGPVTITGTSDGKSGTATVTVTTSPCDASTSIAIGQVLSGALAATDCVLNDGSYMDQYQLPITANGRIQIDVTSTAFDAYLILFIRNPDGSTVAVGADDNSGGGTNARITRDVIAGETYLIGANSLLGGVTGAYQVSVQQGMFIAGATSPFVVAGNDDERIALAKMASGTRALLGR